MKNHLFFYTVAAGVAAGLTLSAGAKEHHKGALTDEAFATKAAAGGITEVEAGKLAQENGESQDVKDFGAKMVTDHGKANDQLKDIASKDKLTIPDKPNAEQQAMLDKLSKEKGAAFDKDYLRHMLMAHRKDLALFKAEAADGKNADLKQFASDTSPVVKSHLDMLEGMKGGSMKGGSMKAAGERSGEPEKSQSTAAQSKSGVGPGGTGEGANAAPTPAGTDNAAPGVPSTSNDSKSGVGPGATGNPPVPNNGAPAATQPTSGQ